ncbi:MAG: glycosyltransferase family 39 protein [Candidatus Micrarchaeaceae archaeon]
MLVLAAILASGLLLGFLVRSAINPLYDDISYAVLAHRFLLGNFAVNGNPFSLSLGVILPLAGSFALLGYGALSAALPTAIAYAVLVFSVFMTCRKLYGNGFAAIAGLFTAASPVVAPYVFRPLPDIPLGALVALSFYLFVSGRKSGSAALFSASGFAIGLSPFIRPDGFVLVVIFAVAAFAASKLQNKNRNEKRVKARYRYVVAGILLALALYFLVLVAYSGGTLQPEYFFYRMVQVSSRSSLSNNLEMLLNVLSPSPRTALNSPYQYAFGPIFLFAIFGCVLSLLRRNELSALAIFNLAVFFYYFLGTSSVSSYVPIIVLSRYLAFVAAPSSIMAAYFVLQVYESVKANSRLYAALSTITLTAFTLALYYYGYNAVYQYNVANIEEASLYGAITNYITNDTGTPNATLYISDGGEGFLIANYINFSVGYRRVSAISIWLNPGIAGNCTYSPNAYLITVDLGAQQSILEQNRQDAYTWAGSGCRLEYEKNITIDGGSASVYKIGRG